MRRRVTVCKARHIIRRFDGPAICRGRISARGKEWNLVIRRMARCQPDRGAALRPLCAKRALSPGGRFQAYPDCAMPGSRARHPRAGRAGGGCLYTRIRLPCLIFHDFEPRLRSRRLECVVSGYRGCARLRNHRGLVPDRHEHVRFRVIAALSQPIVPR